MTRLGDERLLAIADAALTVAGDADMEALLLHQTGGLTRFAGNRIHQSTFRDDLEVRVRVALDGGRVGVASVSDVSAEGAKDAAQRAIEIARHMPPDSGYPGMPGPSAYPQTGGHDEATADASPAERANLIAKVVRALPGELSASGAVSTSELEVAIANSHGVHGTFSTTKAAFSILADAGSGTGYAEGADPALAALDVARLGERASRKAIDSRNPRPFAPGTYPVVLEPAATGTLLQFLGYLGFGAKAYDEGRSFLCGRLGTRVCSELITIVDDALAPDTIGAPFDFEGVPKQAVTLIDHGVADTLLHDFRSAHEHGVQPTGHGLPAPNSEGAFPLNLKMLAGTTPRDELVRGIERGLLVTRFHYTNVVNPIDTTITGMTRDGTFLIENGEIAGGVQNLRCTQSILGALSAVRAVGDRTEMASELFFGAARSPALAIDAFTFSSATTF